MYSFEVVNGLPSEALSYSSLDFNLLLPPRTHHFYFIIPGNPGSARFYEPFAEILYQRLLEIHMDEIVHVQCLSHANHHFPSSFDSSAESRRMGLEAQIFHHLDYMEYVLKYFKKQYLINLTDLKIYLVGHSIGSYIALEVLNRSSLLRRLCSSVILLMPFILWRNIPLHHKRNLKLGKLLAPVIQSSAYVMARAFQCLPRVVRRSILRLPILPHGGVPHLLLHELMSPRLIGNFFSMGVDEVRAISCQDEHVLDTIQAIVKDKINVLAVYTNDDVWAPETDFAEILRATRSIPRKQCLVETVIEKNLTHAFVLDLKAVGIVADIVVRHVVSASRKASRSQPSLRSSL